MIHGVERAANQVESTVDLKIDRILPEKVCARHFVARDAKAFCSKCPAPTFRNCAADASTLIQLRIRVQARFSRSDLPID